MAFIDPARLRDEILEVATRRARALCDKNVPALSGMLAEGFVYINSMGRRLDRNAYLAFVGSGDMRWTAQVLEDVHVHPFGDTVVMTCRVTDVGYFRDEPVRWSYVSTQVYLRHDHTYLYAAGHTATPERG